jgi:uncharacterized membrane protein YphA (DoxX/SURF4 family)
LFTSSVLVGVALFGVISYLLHTKWAKHLDERFSALRPYAHLVIRVGLGVGLAWGATQNALFGPEIPIDSVLSFDARGLVFGIGVLIAIGLATRAAALALVLLYALVLATHGWYALTYFPYAGLALVFLFERGERYSLDTFVRWPTHIFHAKLPHWIERLETWGTKHSFALMRFSFGFAILFAAISVKVMHPALSIAVLEQYNLDFFTNLAAIFIVLCAAFVEAFVGFSILVGVFYRVVLATLFALLVASVLFFGEALWPHLILFTTAIGLFLHGKDEWCHEDKLFNCLWGWTNRFKKSKNPLSPA